MTRQFFGAAIAASALLVACGGNKEPETDPQPTTPDEVNPTEAPGGETSGALDIPDAPEIDIAAINKKKSEEFLTAERAKDSVREIDGGLLIETLAEGNGEKLNPEDLIRFHFTGSLIDGTILQDTRVEGGEPLVVPSPIVPDLESWSGIPIPGLPEGLAAMSEGERARLIVPPAAVEAHYTKEGGESIFAPFTTLIFDLEIVERVGADEEERRAEIVAEQERIMAEAEADRLAAEEEAQKAYEAMLEENRTTSATFLAEVKEKDGVTVTESGLAYEVLEDGGEGDTPAPTDMVTVHYRGTLPDGTVFDESYSGETPAEGDEPISFLLNRVIPGWTEGVGKMNVGDKYRLYIPSELAYGEMGTPGGPIGPEMALVFDVELIEIETPADQGGQ